MTMDQEDSARSNARMAAYICLLFAAVIISIDAFFVIETYTSIESDGSRKFASIAQGFVIVLIAPILFGISGFFPEYKKLFNALGFASIIASIVMMALSQSSSDITAGKVSAKNAELRKVVKDKIDIDKEQIKQMQENAKKLNKSKQDWLHVEAGKKLDATSTYSTGVDDGVKTLKEIKDSTPLVEIVGESWIIAIRVIIAVLMNLVHAALMNAAGDLLRKSFGTVPIGQQILDAIHKIGVSGHGPSAAPTTQQQTQQVQQNQPAPQPANNGLITVSLTKIEPATASNDASPAPAPVTAPAAETAPVAATGLKMPNWFKTIFKAGAATTAPLAGAGQFPLPEPVHAPEITPPSISVQDKQDRAAITLKSVREDEPKTSPAAAEIEPAPAAPAQAQTAPADTLKSVRQEQPQEPVKASVPLALELVEIEAKTAPADALESVRQEQPAKTEKAAKKANDELAGVQVDTGTKYPFNFRYLRIKKLVKKGLKPTVESIKVSDVPCGQDVAIRYRDALVEDGVIEHKGRVYALTEKYQKLLDAKAAKKKSSVK